MEWNRHSSTSSSVGGGLPVWSTFPKHREIGGMLQNTLKDFEKLSAGTPLCYDPKAHTVKLLKCWKIKAKTSDATNTTITLYKTMLTPMLYAGINIMVAPSTVSGTGKSVTVTSVDESVAGEYKITVVTTNMDAINVNGFLVEAASQGSAVAMYCIPDNVSLEDTIGGTQNMVGVPEGMKCLYENTIAAMPDVVKNNIKYVEWDWFAEKQ